MTFNSIDIERGKVLFETIPSYQRPSWAANVLRIIIKEISYPIIIDKVLNIANDSSKWHEGKVIFEQIRINSLKAKEPLEESLLLLAENVAKVIYNSSQSAFPFDSDAGWWIPMNAKFIVNYLNNVDLEEEVWLAINKSN